MSAVPFVNCILHISDTFTNLTSQKMLIISLSFSLFLLADAGDHCASPSQSGHSPAGLGNKQHSLRGANKLTRRARSFKEDFLEKLSQIRTPTNTLSLGRYDCYTLPFPNQMFYFLFFRSRNTKYKNN